MSRNSLLLFLIVAVAASITWFATRERTPDSTAGIDFPGTPTAEPAPEAPPSLAATDPDRPRAPGIEEIVSPPAATTRFQASPHAEPGPSRRVTGRVVDEEGEPLAAATVSAGPKYRARSDEEGRWTLAGFEDPPPSLLLRGAAPGRVPGSVVVQFAGTGDVEAPTIVLRAATTIEGRVVDHERNPVAGVHVEIGDGEARIGMEGNLTQEDGAFRFPVVTQGDWTLTVSPGDGPRGATVLASVPVRGGDRGIEVVLGEPPAGTAKIVANVVDVVSGDPIPVAKAALMRGPEPDPMQLATHGEIRTGTGTVTVEDCTPGSWRLWVQAGSGKVGFAEALVPPDASQVEVWIGIGEAGVLAGRVEFEGVGWEPGLQVSVLPSGSSLETGMPAWSARGKAFAQALVDDAGTFTVEGLLPGRMTVRLAANGLVGEADVDVESGRRTEVVLTARAGSMILFRLEGPSDGGKCFVSYCASGGTGAWDCDPGAYPLGAQGLYFDKTFEAGAVSWAFAFSEEYPGGAAPVERAQTQRGSLTLRAGERLELPIPFVPIGGTR